MDDLYFYFRNQFKQTGNGLVQLILLNIVCFMALFFVDVLCYICGCADKIASLYDTFTFPSTATLFLMRPWSLLSYSFIHKHLLNLFWDMCILSLFGRAIPFAVRSKHIIRIYSLGQVVGACFFLLMYKYSTPFKGVLDNLSGASVPVYAIMAAACSVTPEVRLNYFFISVPIRYIAWAFLAIACLHLRTHAAIHYLAQLSAALAGYLYAKGCKKDFQKKPPKFRAHRTTMSVHVTS